MEEHADAKWNLPGWRIEQKYDTDVLIGNWNEARRVVGEKFRRNHIRNIPQICYNFLCTMIESQQAVYNYSGKFISSIFGALVFT